MPLPLKEFFKKHPIFLDVRLSPDMRKIKYNSLECLTAEGRLRVEFCCIDPEQYTGPWKIKTKKHCQINFVNKKKIKYAGGVLKYNTLKCLTAQRRLQLEFCCINREQYSGPWKKTIEKYYQVYFFNKNNNKIGGGGIEIQIRCNIWPPRDSSDSSFVLLRHSILIRVSQNMRYWSDFDAN